MSKLGPKNEEVLIQDGEDVRRQLEHRSFTMPNNRHVPDLALEPVEVVASATTKPNITGPVFPQNFEPDKTGTDILIMSNERLARRARAKCYSHGKETAILTLPSLAILLCRDNAITQEDQIGYRRHFRFV